MRMTVFTSTAQKPRHTFLSANSTGERKKNFFATTKSGKIRIPPADPSNRVSAGQALRRIGAVNPPGGKKMKTEHCCLYAGDPGWDILEVAGVKHDVPAMSAELSTYVLDRLEKCFLPHGYHPVTAAAIATAEFSLPGSAHMKALKWGASNARRL